MKIQNVQQLEHINHHVNQNTLIPQYSIIPYPWDYNNLIMTKYHSIFWKFEVQLGVTASLKHCNRACSLTA